MCRLLAPALWLGMGVVYYSGATLYRWLQIPVDRLPEVVQRPNRVLLGFERAALPDQPASQPKDATDFLVKHAGKADSPVPDRAAARYSIAPGLPALSGLMLHPTP